MSLAVLGSKTNQGLECSTHPHVHVNNEYEFQAVHHPSIYVVSCRVAEDEAYMWQLNVEHLIR